MKLDDEIAAAVKSGKFVPSEYMRRNRPELFSDSAINRTPILDRTSFEYHLETLTSRNEERQFELFCKRLAEVEICPNLKPQTGPTGGGDSKTDASTFPVAKTLIDRAYWGTPAEPSADNWAFAFSCKKQWRQKAKDDFEKVAGVERKFANAFFISNQFIKDKDRAALENELTKKHGFEVHILDRNWIVDRVLGHGREAIAIESLGLTPADRADPVLGANDVERSTELSVLLNRFANPTEYYASDFFLAADYQRAAFLARSIEKQRHEVEGFFTRARQLAASVGSTKQIIHCAYDYAWTCNWWYDDPARVAKIYAEIEPLLSSITDTEECELFRNLLKILQGALRMDLVDASTARITQRRIALFERLQQLADDDVRPNNALHAESVIWLDKLDIAIENERVSANIEACRERPDFEELFSPSDVTLDDACRQMQSCLERARALPQYPLDTITTHVSQLGEFLPNSVPAFEALIIAAAGIVRDRQGEIAEGELYLQRGHQLLDGSNHRQALLSLGKARVLLSKEETSEQAARAALSCCDAYMHLQFIWSARMEALTALHLALQKTDKGFVSPYFGYLAAHRLCYCELNLKRFGPFFAWYSWMRQLQAQLSPDDFDHEAMRKQIMVLEANLACIILNLSDDDAKELSHLIDGLADQAMLVAHFALRLRVDGEASVLDEFAQLMDFTAHDAKRFFDWLRAELPRSLQDVELGGETRSFWTLQTYIMGVNYRVTTQNKFGAILFVENFLGVMEAMLAIATWENLAFITDEMNFTVTLGPDGRNPPDISMESIDWSDMLTLSFRPDIIQWFVSNRVEYVEWLHKLVLQTVIRATIDPVEDLRSELDKWGAEGTLDRALGTSPIGIIVNDVIGEEAYAIESWY